MKQLTLEEFRETLKEHPHAYLVTFVANKATGSLITSSPRELPLYEIYFMFQDMNQDGVKITITNIIKIA